MDSSRRGGGFVTFRLILWPVDSSRSILEGAVEFLQSSATLRFHRARDFAIRRNIRRIRAVVLADFRELLTNFVDPRLSASAEPHVKFVEAVLAGSVQLRDRAGQEASSRLDRRLGRCRGE